MVWAGLALSFFLLCRASELFAYDDTKLVHPEFCLTRRDLTFRQGSLTLSWQDRERADRVEITFRASKADQTRRGATITRTRLSTSHKAESGGQVGAVEIILELLRRHPSLPMDAPLTTRLVEERAVSTARARATAALRIMVASAGGGEDPRLYALHSGRIGGATQLAAQGATQTQIQKAGRWKSDSYFVYIQTRGEGAAFVSAAFLR